LRGILATIRPNHSNTTSEIVPAWDWTAFEPDRNIWVNSKHDTTKTMSNNLVAIKMPDEEKLD
jgi:hypothetical protein